MHPKIPREIVSLAAALAIGAVLIVRDGHAQPVEYVLAVWNARGDLVHTMTFATREACELSGQLRIKQHPGGTYRCGPRQVYQPRQGGIT